MKGREGNRRGRGGGGVGREGKRFHSLIEPSQFFSEKKEKAE